MYDTGNTLQLEGIDDFDLDAYCRRIGHAGSREPSSEVLAQLLWRHSCTLPFENLSSLAGLPVPLDLPSLEAKMVRQARGGYCFEQNLLLAAALRCCGFGVTGLAARVRWQIPENQHTARTHMLLKVRSEGREYIVDAGFGGVSPTAALRLEEDLEQPTPLETFRLARAGSEWCLEVQLRGGWQPVYRFDLQPQQLPDYRVANWYISTHPSSRFVRSLLVARASAEGRHALSHNELRLHAADGTSSRRAVKNADELRELLRTVFDIDPDSVDGLDKALGRLAAADPSLR